MIHRSKLAAFEISETIDDHNPQSTYEYLTKMIRSMNSQMEKILNNKKFYKDLIEELHSDIAKIQLPYLHFLPDVSKRNNITVKPIIVSQYSATSRLAWFLDGLLRPLLQIQAEYTTFVNGADFIRKLTRHIDKKDAFRSTTIFTTINITNFNTLDSHANMLIVLERFLTDHLPVPATYNGLFDLNLNFRKKTSLI